MLQVQPCKRIYESILETCLNTENLLDDTCHRSLRRRAFVHHVKYNPVVRRIRNLIVPRSPFCRCPHCSGGILNMQRVRAKLGTPQPLQCLLRLSTLEDARQRKLCTKPPAGVRTIHMRHSQHAQPQTRYLREIFLSLKFPLRLFGMRFACLIVLLLWCFIRIVYRSGADFDESFDSSLRRFLSNSQAQLIAAKLVYFIFLRESSLSSAVEDIIELPLAAVWT